MTMKLKQSLFLSALVCISFSALSQSSFPNDWIGIWTGEMKIYAGAEIRTRVNVKFTIQETENPDTWIWKTEYLANDTIVKDYLLKVKDLSKKQYVIDEQDGIILDAYLFDNKLYTFFKVGEFYLSGFYELRNDLLIFEIISGKEGDLVKDEIYNFSINNMQTVSLKREE